MAAGLWRVTPRPTEDNLTDSITQREERSEIENSGGGRRKTKGEWEKWRESVRRSKGARERERERERQY